MKIALNKIPLNGIEINEVVDFPSEYFKDTDIISLNQIEIKGEIKKDLNQDIILDLQAKGNMILPDARTLEEISYPFHIEVNEKIIETNEEIASYFEKEQNSLDIMGILWENIVLEVPMRVTKDSKDTLSKGIGWELKEENEESIDPRLAPLRQLLDEEKE